MYGRRPFEHAHRKATKLRGGGSIGVSGRASDTRIPTVAIQSRPDRTATQVVWSVPHDIVLANCTIHGNLRIWGVGAGGDLDALRTSSRQEGHTARLQAAAPTRIALTNLHLVGTGSIPLYVGPGVTSVAMLGGRVTGRSVSTAVYLDAESAGNTIRGVAFDIATGREQIAIDGSARNRIEANRFALRGRGGVFLYRNCGEDGVIRHQPPSDNIVSNNSFQGAAWFQPRTVLVGAREGRRRYCGDDAGWPFGSSLDDGDNATGNVVSGNTSRYRWLPDWITGWLQAGRGAVSAP